MVFPRVGEEEKRKEQWRIDSPEVTRDELTGDASLAEQMVLQGCRWRPSDRSAGSRIAGKNEVHRRLQIQEDVDEDNTPGMVVFHSCINLVSQLPSIPLDPKNPEDVNTKSEDHLYDALRYGVMSRPRKGIFDFTIESMSDRYIPSDATFGY